MNKELICFVDPFIIQWGVFSADEHWKTSVSLNDFEAILQICEEQKANVFHFMGSQAYAEELADELNKLQMIKYHKNKIKVEVN